MRKILAGGVSALLLTGAIVSATAIPASAAGPAVTATCLELRVVADGYETQPGTDAVTEQRVVTPAVPYQAAVYGPAPLITPAVEYQPAVYETEYEFRHKLLFWKTAWKTDPNWNAEENDHSLGWYATGQTRETLVSPEIPAQDAVYGPAPLISPEVQAQDAVYETVEVTPAAVGDETPNTVEVVIDGVSRGVEEFGTSYDTTIPLTGTGHTYEVHFVAWNDPNGYDGLTTSYVGSVEACPLPPMPAPRVTYGEWGEWVVNCDTQRAYRERIVSVRSWTWYPQIREWVLNPEPDLFQDAQFRDATVEECPELEPGPVVVEPTDGPAVTPTETPAAAPTPTAAPVVASAESLAETGGADLRPLIFGGALAMLAGLIATIVVAIRRRG